MTHVLGTPCLSRFLSRSYVGRASMVSEAASANHRTVYCCSAAGLRGLCHHAPRLASAGAGLLLAAALALAIGLLSGTAWLLVKIFTRHSEHEPDEKQHDEL